MSDVGLYGMALTVLLSSIKLPSLPPLTDHFDLIWPDRESVSVRSSTRIEAGSRLSSTVGWPSEYLRFS